MRIKYESKRDKQKERNVAKRVADLWDVVARENPEFYPVDFCFTDDKNEVSGFGEIKVRTHEYGRYPTYIVSAHKVADAKSLANATGLSVILIVQWTCGTIAFLDFDHPPVRTTWGGRQDRSDGQDMEPVNHYDIEQFTIATKEPQENDAPI